MGKRADPEGNLLRAISSDCQGRRAEVAEAFPDDWSQKSRESEVGAILRAQRRPSLAFLLAVVSDPERAETLRLLADAAQHKVERRPRPWEELREVCAERLERLACEVSEIRDALAEADVAQERERPTRRAVAVRHAPVSDRKRA